MRIVPGSLFQQFLSIVNIACVTWLSVLSPLPAVAQNEGEPPKVDANTLDQVVARIALYPDPCSPRC